MDDFTTGPRSFDVVFVSSDSINQDGSITFHLKKPLEFANEWEVGVKQIIIKSPFNSGAYKVFYDKATPDGKFSTESLILTDIGIPRNPKELLELINSKIPNSIKNDLSFSLQDDNFVHLNVKNTKIRFQDSYLTDILGFSSEREYTSKHDNVRGNKKLELLCPIFTVTTDITLPGSEILSMDVLKDTDMYENYKYEKVSYYGILRSYISSINIAIKDIHNKPFKIREPFVIKLSFRRCTYI